MSRISRLLLTTALAATVTLAVGCQTTMYDWGSYEASVLNLSLKDGSEADPQQEAARLAKEVQKTQARERLVPPGKYAHLAYLCYLDGDFAAARTYFEAEKQAFPESARFMDFMLSRLEEQ